MRNSARYLALLLLLTSFGLLAENAFEIIELRYRTADELLPVLRPLVEPEGTISATQNKLIVRAPRENLRELRKLVSQLDTAPRQLLVTVRQGSHTDSTTRAAGVAGTGRFGDVTVTAPRSVDPSLPGIGVAGSRGAVEVHGGRRDTQSSDSGDQQLRVMDGREAVIYVGQEVPYTTRSVGPGGVVTVNTELKSVLTGFVVRPRIQGDQVTLDISPQQENLDSGRGGAINVSRLSTSITGKLGEWIDLGAVTQQGQVETSGTLSHSTTDSQSSQQVWVKVEVQP